MLTKLPIFEKVVPEKLASLSRGEHSKLSAETITSLIEECIRKVNNLERLNSPELSMMITFFDKIDQRARNDFQFYMEKHLGSNELEDYSVIEAFDELYPVSFLKMAFETSFVKKSISEEHARSFSSLFSGRPPTPEMPGESIISYLEGLKISRRLAFTKGQIRQAKFYLENTNFGLTLENNFETLLNFLEKLGLDGPAGIAKFLDIQIGKRLIEDPKGIRVKVTNELLGYFKYQKYVTKNNLSHSNLPNLLILKKIVTEIGDAIRILSEQEIKRGSFWQSMFDQMDGLEIQKNPYAPNYKVGIAFYINQYVICDFGPTGNPIHFYERRVFDQHIKDSRNWKREELTTNAFGPGKKNHVGYWESEMKIIIRKARNA